MKMLVNNTFEKKKKKKVLVLALLQQGICCCLYNKKVMHKIILHSRESIINSTSAWFLALWRVKVLECKPGDVLGVIKWMLWCHQVDTCCLELLSVKNVQNSRIMQSFCLLLSLFADSPRLLRHESLPLPLPLPLSPLPKAPEERKAQVATYIAESPIFKICAFESCCQQQACILFFNFLSTR